MTAQTKLIHYGVLMLMLVGGAITFIYLQGNEFGQLLIGVATSVGYVLWGILHHLSQNDLNKKVMVEYVLIGAIAVALLFIVLQG